MPFLTMNSSKGPDVFLMRVKLDKNMPEPLPGQFYMIQPSPMAPLLPRPLAAFEYDHGSHVVSFMYQIKGTGTRMIHDMFHGQEVHLFGPYGKPFDFRAHPNLVLVGGGIGIAGLNFLAQANKYNIKDGTCRAYLGFNGRPYGLEYFELNTGNNVHYSTSGFVTSIMDVNPGETVVACGPKAMLKKVCELVSPENDVFISVDSRMACGVGACLGCVKEIPLRYKSTGDKYVPMEYVGPKRVQVCTEGPILKREVV